LLTVLKKNHVRRLCVFLNVFDVVLMYILLSASGIFKG
jgi:hypothetical protein